MSVGSMLVLLSEGESMAAGGGHARRREGDRARDGGAVGGCVPARGWACRKLWGEQGVVAVRNGAARATWGYLAVWAASPASVAIPMLAPGSGRHCGWRARRDSDAGPGGAGGAGDAAVAFASLTVSGGALKIRILAPSA